MVVCAGAMGDFDDRARARRRRRAATGFASLVLAAALLAGARGEGSAQPGGGGAPTLNVLALDWARGFFVAPLLCEIEGTPRRGGRRIVIGPSPQRGGPPSNRISFTSLQVAGAARCFTDFGGEEFDVTGAVTIALPGPARPDIAVREFSSALRRNPGFDFEIRSGTLRIESVGPDPEPTREVDFKRGRAGLHEIAPGSDAARLLRSYGKRRQLTLELAARDGTRLAYHMVQSAESR